MAAHSKHQDVLSQAVQGAHSSSAVIAHWMRFCIALQQTVADAEQSIAFADYSATARQKFRDRLDKSAAAAAFWAIVPKWLGLASQLLREADFCDRVSGTAGMALAVRTRLRKLQEEHQASSRKAARKRVVELDWARFILQLFATRMLPNAWADHHQSMAAWVGTRCTSIQRDMETMAAAEAQHRYLKEVWSRMVALQLHHNDGKEQQSSVLQHCRAAKQASASAAAKADQLETELQECKRRLEAERQRSQEERWGRMALSLLRELQSVASFANLKTVTSRAASQRRMSELHLQQVEAERQADSLRALEEIDMATAKAAAEVATVGVQEAAIRRWQLLVLFTFQLQFRVCNQYVLNAVSAQQRAVQQIALENSNMRPHLVGLQSEVALAWWARFATFVYLQASAQGTRRTLADLMMIAQEGARSSATHADGAWLRMSQLLRSAGPAAVLRLLRDANEVQGRKREASHAQQVAKMQETVRAHAAQALTAHQLLFQEAKRTLSHVRRFRNPALVPQGLEEQCELAVQRCSRMLEQNS